VIFLIDYDTRRGEIINLWEFQDAHKLRALYAKLQLELALAKRCDVLRETPILEAADLSTLGTKALNRLIAPGAPFDQIRVLPIKFIELISMNRETFFAGIFPRIFVVDGRADQRRKHVRYPFIVVPLDPHDFTLVFRVRQSADKTQRF
jgi:hypothetical protein